MSTNEELLNSAMSEEPVELATAEAPEAEQQGDAGQLRDEHGRFAAAQAQPQATEETQQQQREAFVPSGRLREEREAREALQRRYDEERNSWTQRFNQLEDRMRQQSQPAPAPKPQVDPLERVFQDPTGLVTDTVQPLLDPVTSQIANMREFYSQKEAVREFGKEKVQAAYQWIAEGMQTRDPSRIAIYQRAMQSMDPYGEIVGEHQKSSVYSQIGNDPNQWFSQTLKQRLASDPKFAAEVMQEIQGSVGQQPQARETFQLPPNLRRAPGARSGSEESGDLSNAALMQNAMR